MSFITPQPCPPSGGGGPEFDTEVVILCDVLAGNVVGTAIAVYEYDESTGMPVGAPTFVIPGTNTPYVVQGTLQPCGQPDANSEILCDIQPDGSSVQFVRTYHFSSAGIVTGSADSTLAGAVYAPTGTVGECDPYTLCTPSPNLDLNGDCGPGESPTKATIAADTTHPLANSVFIDDTAADPLCGGTWDNPAAALAAPFPVDESFRNATFDQPGPVTQGTAPYPQLTAGAPVNDGAGNGWLRVADLNSGTNGIWQVPAPFPTSQGVTAAITHASHDGTIPGGDGAAFVFTDGSVAPQATPIGGFGNLGLVNWQGGYVAVVLDEYGQSCTCDQTAPPGSPFGGPCGFCTNTISIQLAGTARIGASCACCTIAQMPLNPKAINQTTRSQPLRLITSIIAEGGQTFVSASIDWNDGNGPVQYFDRVNVTACAGPPPATLRMAAFGGSGGSFRAVKEYRDASARPAGSSHWRAFPIVTDPIPACVTLVNVNVCVDVTFNSDTQVAGNGDPEAYLWLVNEATNTVVDRAQQTSIPSQVGTPHNLCVDASVPPAQLANLMIYVGSEARDQNGEYDTLWENLKVTVNGTGCPATPVRTMAISAPCPIPVTIVGGSADSGGGGGTTVFNAPSTFEDVEICMTVGGVRQPGFRRELRAPDGSITVTFLGQDGLAVPVVDTWEPGPCNCGGTVLGTVCIAGPGPLTTPLTVVRDCDSTIHYFNQSTGIEVIAPAIVGCGSFQYFEEILCDGGNADHQFIRRYVGAATAGINSVEYDLELDGATAYVVVGPVHVCVPTSAATELDVELITLCDTNGPFLRRFTYDETTGLPTAVVDTTLAGVAYVPVGTIGVCDQNVTVNDDDVEQIQHCDTLVNGTKIEFYKRLTFDHNGVLLSTVLVDASGNPYVPVGTVTVGDCAACCPIPIGEGCATGGRKWTSIRNVDGTVTLVNQQDGTTVLQADVITCPTDSQTLRTQHFDVVPGSPWTPALVTGTITSLTYVILTGTATVVDFNGTSIANLPAGLAATWNDEEDGDALNVTGTSITAAAASRVLVLWTER